MTQLTPEQRKIVERLADYGYVVGLGTTAYKESVAIRALLAAHDALEAETERLANALRLCEFGDGT